LIRRTFETEVKNELKKIKTQKSAYTKTQRAKGKRSSQKTTLNEVGEIVSASIETQIKARAK
jgi:hypothetical protein